MPEEGQGTTAAFGDIADEIVCTVQKHLWAVRVNRRDFQGGKPVGAVAEAVRGCDAVVVVGSVADFERGRNVEGRKVRFDVILTVIVSDEVATLTAGLKREITMLHRIAGGCSPASACPGRRGFREGTIMPKPGPCIVHRYLCKNTMRAVYPMKPRRRH